MLGVKPAAGRFFVPEEQQRGAAKAAVISYALWQRLFAGTNKAIGAKLPSGSSSITVVGVLPKGLEYPPQTDVFLARETEVRYPSYTAGNWRLLARVKPNVTLDQARQDVSLVLRQLKAQVGDYTYTVDGTVVPLRDQIVGQIRPILLLLFGASGVLLLIACTNVVNLLVARMAAREGELAVRVALGAGRGRLIQQLLIEAALPLAVGMRGGSGVGVRRSEAAARAATGVDPSAVGVERRLARHGVRDRDLDGRRGCARDWWRRGAARAAICARRSRSRSDRRAAERRAMECAARSSSCSSR